MLQAPALQKVHRRGQGENAEYAVAEKGERGVGFDPGGVAEYRRPVRAVPGGNRKRENGEQRGEGGREHSQEAHAECGPDEYIQGDRRPDHELHEFESIRQGATAVLQAAGVEADRLQDPAKAHQHERVASRGVAAQLQGAVGPESGSDREDDGGQEYPLAIF